MVGALITVLALFAVGLVLLDLTVLGIIFAACAVNLLVLSILVART